MQTNILFLLNFILFQTNRFWQYTFDYFYYEIVEAPLLVITWHGLYNISDLFIYPDDKQLSLITSFASGYLVYFVLALIQIPVARCMLKIGNRTLHSIVTNIFHLIAFVGVVQIWRSLWLICEQYLNIANYHNTTLWLCYGVSFPRADMWLSSRFIKWTRRIQRQLC